jgi:hypothetical protein
MLVHARMKRAVLAMALVTVSSGVASAGMYIGLGIGTGPSLSTSNDDRVEEDGRSARLMLGYRFGRISVEGAVTGYDMAFGLQTSLYASEVRQGSISGKYNHPLADGFEAFGRIGYAKTWFSIKNDERFDASGTGIMLGAGIEYRLKLGLAGGASLWLDYQYSRAALEGDLIQTDLNAAMWTLGATIAF